MPGLYYEYLSTQDPLCHCVKVSTKHSLSILHLRQDIESIMQTNSTSKTPQYYLLDESRFSFYNFNIEFDTAHEVTIHDLKRIKQEKLTEIKKKHGASGQLLQTFMDTIFINGIEKDHAIGHSGNIFFRLYFIFIRPQTLHTCNRYRGDIYLHTNITLLPQSLQTVLFLRKQLNKDNFLLLYIHKNICKAIKIHNGFYEQGEILNLGISTIKKMYKEHGISNYRYQDQDYIQANPLAKQLITESLEFYCEQLCQRGTQKNLFTKDVIVISSLATQPFFIDVFNSVYNKYHKGFIVPFHRSNQLDTYHIQRDPEDIDILIALNRLPDIRKLLYKQTT